MIGKLFNRFKPATAIKLPESVKQTKANIAGQTRSITYVAVPRYIQQRHNSVPRPITTSITTRKAAILQPDHMKTINRLKQGLSLQAEKNLKNFNSLRHKIRTANNEQTLKHYLSLIDSPIIFEVDKQQEQKLKDEVTLRRLDLAPEPPSTEPNSTPGGNRIAGNYNRESFKTKNAATLEQLAKKLDKKGAVAFYQDIQTHCFNRTLNQREQNNIRATLLPIIFKKP